MTYATTNPPKLIAQGIAAAGLWAYASTDVHTDVDAAGYFTNGHALGMKVGDVVLVIETDNNYAQTTHAVTAVTAGGAATVSGAS